MADLLNTDWIGGGMGFVQTCMDKITAMDMGSLMGLFTVILGIVAIFFAFSQIGKDRY